MQVSGGRVFSNLQLVMTVYIRIVRDNNVTTVNFATSKSLVVNSTMFPHRNIHKHTSTCPDGKTHSPVDHMLIDRRWHSRVPDVRYFREDDCDTDHYVVVAEVRERLAVSK